MTDIPTLNARAAANIRAEMGRQNIRPTDLADRLKWPRSTATELLKERSRITLDKLEQVADVLGLDPADLLKD